MSSRILPVQLLRDPTPTDHVVMFVIFLICNLLFTYLFNEVIPVFKNPKYPKFVRILAPAVVGASFAVLIFRGYVQITGRLD